MLKINDIFYKVEKGLIDHNYYQKNIEEQKELIELEIKKYIISKLEEFNLKVSIQLSIYELIYLLSQKLDTKNKEELLTQLIHYILNIISAKQNYIIIWYVEDDISLIENPILKFDKNNICDKLLTHKDTDNFKTFCFIFDTFKNNMFLNEKQKKLAINS